LSKLQFSKGHFWQPTLGGASYTESVVFGRHLYLEQSLDPCTCPILVTFLFRKTIRLVRRIRTHHVTEILLMICLTGYLFIGPLQKEDTTKFKPKLAKASTDLSD